MHSLPSSQSVDKYQNDMREHLNRQNILNTMSLEEMHPQVSRESMLISTTDTLTRLHGQTLGTVPSFSEFLKANPLNSYI